MSRTKAVASRQLHTYAQRILKAIQEVEDALVREARQREFIDSLAKQLKLSQEVIAKARQRYANGERHR